MPRSDQRLHRERVERYLRSDLPGGATKGRDSTSVPSAERYRSACGAACGIRWRGVVRVLPAGRQPGRRRSAHLERPRRSQHPRRRRRTAGAHPSAPRRTVGEHQVDAGRRHCGEHVQAEALDHAIERVGSKPEDRTRRVNREVIVEQSRTGPFRDALSDRELAGRRWPVEVDQR